MAAIATTDVINGLRYTYGTDELVYIASQEVPLWNVLQKTKKDVGGRGQFILPILKQNPGNFTGIAQGGAIPSSLSPATTEASYALQEFAGVYEVSWKLIQDARTSKFAFQQAIQMMDDGLRRRIFRLINAEVNGTGRGELGRLSAASNADPFTVAFLPRVEPGMVIDVKACSDDNTDRVTAGRTVTAVDALARTIKTGSALASTAANDYVTTTGTVSSAICYHMNGMLGILDKVNPAKILASGNASTSVPNIGNIDRTTAGNEFWQSPVLSNSGTLRVLNEDLLLQAEDAVREKGGASLTHYFSNLAIGRRYHEQLRADTFVTLSKPGSIAGGLGRDGMKGGEATSPDSDGGSGYNFGGTKWYFDPFFDSNTVIGFDRSHFFIGTGDNELPQPISEIFGEGTPFFSQTNNATWQVRWYWQGNTLTDNPAAGVKVLDIAES